MNEESKCVYSIVQTLYGETLIATESNQLIAFLFLSENKEKMIKLFHSKFSQTIESTSEDFMEIANTV